MSIVAKVKKKLNEYGLEVYNDYPSEETSDEHIFYVEDMILFVDKKEKRIGVSFQATMKPEKAANITLMLSEVENSVDVMESFIFNKKNECIVGNDAFKLIEETKRENIAKHILQEQVYTNLLLNSNKGYEC